jgi:hypothetical protein
MISWVARLDSVRQKIAHAELHLKLLNSEIDRYMSSNPGEVVPNPDSNPDRPTFLYRQKEIIPARISFLVGDCLQNLRSAFDYLIWELVLAAGNVPDKPNMFPVCLTERGFKEAKRGDRLKDIAAGAETLVKGLQPYTHTQPTEHWLAILDNLANINKHRGILLASISAFSMSGLMAELERMVTSGDLNVADATQDAKSGNVLPLKK